MKYRIKQIQLNKQFQQFQLIKPFYPVLLSAVLPCWSLLNEVLLVSPRNDYHVARTIIGIERTISKILCLKSAIAIFLLTLSQPRE